MKSKIHETIWSVENSLRSEKEAEKEVKRINDLREEIMAKWNMDMIEDYLSRRSEIVIKLKTESDESVIALLSREKEALETILCQYFF